MWLLVIVICSSVYSYSCAYTNDILEIKINIFHDVKNGGDLKCKGDTSNIVFNEGVRLYVNTTQTIYRCRCYKDGDVKNVLFRTLWKEKDRPAYFSMESIVTQTGSSQYTCEFFTSLCDNKREDICYYYIYRRRYIDKGISCSVQVNVLKREDISNPEGFLSANGETFNATKDTNYYFYDGQPTNFTCHQTTGGFVKLSYIFKRATKYISTDFQPADSVDLYMKLTVANSDSFLICTVTDQLYKQSIVIRLHLVLHKPTNDLGFEVNGLLLFPTQGSGNEGLYYEYKYYHNEPLTIKVVKNDTLYTNLYCTVPAVTNLYNITQLSRKGNLLQTPLKITFYQGQTNTKLICTVSKNEQNKRITITLIYQSHNHNPYIVGLSMANILWKYTNATSHVIKYNYTGSEKLVLECKNVVSNQGTEWSYAQNGITAYGTNPRTFALNPDCDIAIINCIAKGNTDSKKVILELVRLRNEVMTATRSPGTVSTGLPTRATPATTTTSLTIATTSTYVTKTVPTTFAPITISPIPKEATVYTFRPPIVIVQTTTPISVSEPETTTPAEVRPTSSPEIQGSDNGVVWTVICVVILIIIVAVLTLSHLRRRRQQANMVPTDNIYQNLLKHNEGLISAQSNTNGADSNTYAVPNTEGNIEALYSKPVPKNQRKPKVFNLAGIVQNGKKSEPTYACVQKNTPTGSVQNNDPMYASVKNSDPTYASLKQSGSTYASVQKDDPTYASVQGSEPTYASVQKNEPKYASVQKCDRTTVIIQNGVPTYASVQKSEPTYASVQNGELAYASVQKNTADSSVQKYQEPTYAEVEKQSKYQNPKVIEGPVKDQIYTQIEFQNHKGNKVRFSNSTYAEVMAKTPEETYANVDKLKEYNNSSVDNHYANANLRSESEPAYCKVNAVKKSGNILKRK